MRARAIDLRLVIPALAAWLTAGVLIAAPEHAWATGGASAGLVAAVTSVFLARRWRWGGVAVLVLTAVGLAAFATGAVGAARHPRALDLRASGHQAVIDATVVSAPRAAGGSDFGGDRVAFRVTARTVVVGDTSIHGRMPATVYTTSGRADPRIGERVRVTGTLAATGPADRVAFFVFSGHSRTVTPAPVWLGWANGVRERFAEACTRLPAAGGELLPGLALGDESRVSAGLDADMKASSLSHLTAVSGSNCAIVVAGLLGLGAGAGLARRWRVALSLLGLAGFVVLVTPGASVLRAAVMASIVVFGAALGRPARALPALALAVIALLVQNPWLARDYGFALSVLATAALLVFARPLAAWLGRWLPHWLAGGLAVPMAAQLACQPVLVLLNPALPLYGVVANVLAAPAAPIATVVGLLASLALPLLAPLAAPLLWVAWLPAAWIAGIAHTSVGLPASAVPWPSGFAGFALAAVLTGLVAALIARPATARGRRVRGAWAASSVVVLLLAAAWHAGPPLAARAGMPRDWVVGLCDVGQGDAVVLHSGAEYGLIDTGRDPDALAACLKRLGIRQLALLVLTHYDLDHVGASAVVAAMTGTALVAQPEAGNAAAERRLDELRRHGVRIHFATRGDAGALGLLRWRVLWPDRTRPETLTGNQGSVTLEVEGPQLRMVFLADLDEKAQEALLSDGGVTQIDVVKVAHHGSADQSARLYGVLGAQLGLISCGLGNDYGHPRARALDLLRAAGTRIARTDLEGTVLVTSRSGRLVLWSARQTSERALWAPAGALRQPDR